MLFFVSHLGKYRQALFQFSSMAVPHPLHPNHGRLSDMKRGVGGKRHSGHVELGEGLNL